jgi:hypothetical protein
LWNLLRLGLVVFFCAWAGCLGLAVLGGDGLSPACLLFSIASMVWILYIGARRDIRGLFVFSSFPPFLLDMEFGYSDIEKNIIAVSITRIAMLWYCTSYRKASA